MIIRSDSPNNANFEVTSQVPEKAETEEEQEFTRFCEEFTEIDDNTALKHLDVYDRPPIASRYEKFEVQVETFTDMGIKFLFAPITGFFEKVFPLPPEDTK